MSANDKQVAGQHYKNKAIQTWDYIASNNIPYLEGNIIKYVSRWRDKGGVEDLHKAMHYLEKLIDTEKAASPHTFATRPTQSGTCGIASGTLPNYPLGNRI